MRGTRYTVAIIVLLAATAVALLLLFRLLTAEPQTDPTHITLDGVTTCLPHKDTSGPVTLECALGLQADDGRHYALQQLGTWVETGVRVQVSGTLLEPAADEKYDIAGTVEVSQLTKK